MMCRIRNAISSQSIQPSSSARQHKSRRKGSEPGPAESVRRRKDEELERETGFEPATAGLENRNSSTELLPLASLHVTTRDCSKAMAVRANDVALVDFREDPLHAC